MPREEDRPIVHTQTPSGMENPGDNILKQCVCFGIQRGPRLYFKQQQDIRQRESEREQEYTHIPFTLTVKEIQEA